VWGAKQFADAPGSLISERLRCRLIVGNHAHASLPKMNDMNDMNGVIQCG